MIVLSASFGLSGSHGIVRAAFSLYLCTLMLNLAGAWEPKNKAVRNGADPLVMECDALTESSGIAFSNRNSNCIWSHNDSGGKPRLYAFTSAGRHCGRIFLVGARATDWEDMDAYKDGRPRLLVADVGDNDAKRRAVTLYLFDEPDPRRKTKVDSFQKITVRYFNGPQNCEAVAVDVKNRRILLFGKSSFLATMHAIDLPEPPKLLPPQDSSSDSPADAPAERKRPFIEEYDMETKEVARMSIPLATGMDLCEHTGDLWISGYSHAFRFPSGRKNVPLGERLRLVPQMIELPKLKQIEAIAIDEKGRSWVASEGRPAKMQRVSLPK